MSQPALTSAEIRYSFMFVPNTAQQPNLLRYTAAIDQRRRCSRTPWMLTQWLTPLGWRRWLAAPLSVERAFAPS